MFSSSNHSLFFSAAPVRSQTTVGTWHTSARRYVGDMQRRAETTAEWVARWRSLGPLLERERAADFAAMDLSASIRRFDGLLESSLRLHPPSGDSGLIEQQRLFRRLRDAEARS